MAADQSLKLFMQQVNLRADARYQAHRGKWLRRLHPGENVIFSILGITCLAISAVVVEVTIMATLDIPARPWTIPSEVRSQDLSLTEQSRLDSDGSGALQPTRVVTRVIQRPGPALIALTVLGAAIGCAGLVVGWRQERLAWTSILGTAVIALSTMLEVARYIYLGLQS